MNKPNQGDLDRRGAPRKHPRINKYLRCAYRVDESDEPVGLYLYLVVDVWSRKIVAWALTVMIVGFVVGVQFLPEIWRAIVDLGVVFGLSTGLLSILWFFVRALTGHVPDVNPDLP